MYSPACSGEIKAAYNFEKALQAVVQLVGPDALPDNERLVLEIAKMIKEVFLQQNAFSDNDGSCSMEKNLGLLEVVLAFYAECQDALKREVTLGCIMDFPVREEIARMRDEPNEGFSEKKDGMIEKLKHALRQLEVKGRSGDQQETSE